MIETKTSYVATKDILLKAELPQQTRTYKPITHQQLIDLTLESIHQAGFTLDKETYSSAREGNIANGRYTIRNVADSEMQLQIGWQNSYDKSLSLKFAIGASIFICQNGAVHGDMGSFRKKHMGTVQEFTPSAITEYIKQAGDTFKTMQTEREAMKQIEITKRVKAELIGRMLIEESFITSTQMNIIARELENPSYDYGCQNSMWELYNFTTHALKETHPLMNMNAHMKAHKFFVNEAGLFIPTVEPQAVEESDSALGFLQMTMDF